MLAEPCPAPPSSSAYIHPLLPFLLLSEKRGRLRRRPRPPYLCDDLIADILLRLPAKYVARFRSVSKRWLSISSDPKFLRLHRSLYRRPLTGFFLKTAMFKFTYYPIRSSALPPPPVFHPTLSLPGINPSDPALIYSFCNDLILYRDRKQVVKSCHCYPSPEPQPLIHVFNLKTLQHTTFFPPEKMEHWSWGHAIVSDPSRFPPNNYKVISSGNRMHIYNSDTRSWKLIFDPAPMLVLRNLYWEGSLVGIGEKLSRLDVEGEFVETIPWPAGVTMCHYLGESGGRLHLISSSHRKRILTCTHFDVFEMESLDSGWSIAHRVNLEGMKDIYPEVAVPLPRLPKEGEGEGEEGRDTFPRISVVYFHRGGKGKERGDQLFLSLPRKIVSYHLQDKTFTIVADNVIAQNEDIEDCFAETEYKFFQFLPHVVPYLLFN